MPKESRASIERPALPTHAAHVAMQCQFTLRLCLLAIPFAFGFHATGASPMVALLTGLAVALLAGAPQLLPTGVVLDTFAYRGVMQASGAMLFTACGVQALVWRFGLSSHSAGVLILQCTTVQACVFLLMEAARTMLRPIWRRIDK